MMHRSFRLFFFFVPFLGCAQLFQDQQNTALVKSSVDYIYNMQQDTAERSIDLVSYAMPDHPVVPLLRAMNLLWSSIPYVTEKEIFDRFTSHLYEVVRLANKLDGGRQEDPEAVFFELSARGLLAEYYAEAGNYLKAIAEAGEAYYLLKSANELAVDNPEFLLPVGVYNYFREMYPKKHPSYNALLWLFRGGDAPLGLAQIKQACERSVLTKVEAYIYLSYIYLRYEELPELARDYLYELCIIYPENLYVITKYLESIADEQAFGDAPLEMINKLIASGRPYYLKSGYALMGMYQEFIHDDLYRAEESYVKGLKVQMPGHDKKSHHQSLIHLGLARLYNEQDQKEKSMYHAEQAIDVAEVFEVGQQAKKILYSLK